MTSPKVLLYSAESRLRPPLVLMDRLRTTLRRRLHFYTDAAHFRHGDLSRLDYRNYEGRDTINMGDVAIYQSAAALIKRLLPAAHIQPMNWGELKSHSLTKTDQENTTLVFNGSGYFHVELNGRLASRIKEDFDWWLRHPVPAVFFGVGLNRPGSTDLNAPVALHPDDAALVSQWLSLAQAVSVRDASTQAALAPWTTKPVHLIGDPALHFCHALGITPSREKAASARKPPLIGINFSFHGKISTLLLRNNLEAYCAVLLKLQKNTGADYHYFVHYEIEKILPKFLAQRGVKIKKVGAGDTASLVNGYGEIDLHIGGMLHSCILATSAGTPCIGLAYDIKHQGFFDLMGLSENCLSAASFDPEALYARAMDLLANPQPVRAHITAQRQMLETETLHFLQEQFAL